jgi:hypothetical protein
LGAVRCRHYHWRQATDEYARDGDNRQNRISDLEPHDGLPNQSANTPGELSARPGTIALTTGLNSQSPKLCGPVDSVNSEPGAQDYQGTLAAIPRSRSNPHQK